ncbi:MAG: 8-amino-7-oxononanoate synthase [Gammaproteobacteria bacterium]
MRDLAAELARLRTEHLYRRRAVVDGPQGAEIVVDGTRYLSFCSNDYLGLASHPRVSMALKEGAEKYGAGSGASHLVTGHQRPHHALEEALAAFTRRPRALLFSSGYLANLGTVAALMGRGDTVWEDRLNHASLLDAGRLAGARLQRYPHCDAAALRRRLTEHAGRCDMIISDGVFSMDGDLAPLPQLAKIAREHQACLMVDDAHGLGVMGAHGRGALEHFGLEGEAVPVLIGTLGKAFGTCGAFVAGGEDLIEYLIQRARPYVYTTALPPAVAHATLASLQVLQEEAWRRQHLHDLITRFRRGAEQLGVALLPSSTPIQPLVVGAADRALALSQALRRHGIYVSAIRPPTVPKGTARLRITLSAAHSEAQVDRLLSTLESVS